MSDYNDSGLTDDTDFQNEEEFSPELAPLDCSSMSAEDLREYMQNLRGELDYETRQHAATMVNEYLSEVILEVNPRVVAFYSPIKNEIDITPIAGIAEREFGMGVALPQVIGESTSMAFNLWDTQKNDLIKDIKNVPCSEGHEVSPDLILVPLLAFDMQGNRLGSGQGFYDRTLAEYPDSLKVGIAYSFQQVDSLESMTQEHDIPLHAIITQEELLYCQNGEDEDNDDNNEVVADNSPKAEIDTFDEADSEEDELAMYMKEFNALQAGILNDDDDDEQPQTDGESQANDKQSGGCGSDSCACSHDNDDNVVSINKNSDKEAE